MTLFSTLLIVFLKHVMIPLHKSDPLTTMRSFSAITFSRSFPLKFAKAGIKYEKLSDLLQPNVKNHFMKTRGNEKYDVTFANTGRLKNSSIITVQNMLNTDYENNKTRNCG